MTTIDETRLARVEQFGWTSARLLERVRFEHLFRGGPSERVLGVLRGYQNPDGGFGQALEPDFRGPISQPLALDFALRVMEEHGRADMTLLGPALDWLESVTAADGGVPNVVPRTDEYPRAPWWQPAPGFPGSLLPTGSIAGALYRLGVQHRWLARATAFSWSAIDAWFERAKAARAPNERMGVAYLARAAVVFLDHVPERARAERAAGELGRVLLEAKLVAGGADGGDAAEMEPLDFASEPTSLARRWFADAVIEQSLDGYATTLAADGGASVPWPIWTPVTEHEWRGVLTLEQLKTLRAYGRFRRG